MPNRRYKIGFISENDPLDKRSLSGTPHRHYLNLKEAGADLVWIPVTRNIYTRFLVLVIKIFARLLFCNSSPTHTKLVARRLAASVNRELTEGCDLLFVPNESPVIYGLNTSVPIIYFTDTTFHAHYNYYPKFSSFLPFNRRQGELIERRALEKSASVIVSSDWARDSVINDYKIDGSKVTTLELCSNLESRDIPPLVSAPQKEKREERTLKILFLGVDWERKGGDIAVETCRLLNLGIGGVPIKCTIHIAGIKEIPERYLNCEYVVNEGFLNKNNSKDYNHLIELLSGCDLMLLPTRAECAGVVFSEASAFSLPIFTYSTGGIPNYVVDGLNGRLLPLSATAADFAAAISGALLSGEVESFRRGCREIYTSKLNCKRWSNEFNQIAESVLQTQRTKQDQQSKQDQQQLRSHATGTNSGKESLFTWRVLLFTFIAVAHNFMPDALFGPSIILIALSLLFVFHKKIEISSLKYTIPLLAIFTLGLLSKQPGWDMHVRRDFIYALIPVALIYTGYWLAEGKRLWPDILRVIILIAIIFSLVHLFKLATIPSLLSQTYSDIRSAVLPPKGYLIVLSLNTLLFRKRLRLDSIFPSPIKRYTVVALLSISLLLSFSRTMLVAGLLIAFVIWITTVKINIRSFAGALLIAITATGLMFLAPSDNQDGFIGKITRSTEEIALSDYTEMSEINRNWRGFEAYRALESFNRGTFGQKIGGQGFGSQVDLGFSMMLADNIYEEIPVLHNGYAYVLVKMGILGLLLYLIFYFTLLRYSIRHISLQNNDIYPISRLLPGITLAIVASMLVVGGIAQLHETDLLLLAGYLIRRVELSLVEERAPLADNQLDLPIENQNII